MIKLKKKICNSCGLLTHETDTHLMYIDQDVVNLNSQVMTFSLKNFFYIIKLKLILLYVDSGVTTRRFIGHTKDVLSVAFSADNRQIVSGSRDNTIKLWNTLGVCKYTINEENHTEWVSCVRFSPNTANPIIVSAGWDKLVKV